MNKSESVKNDRFTIRQFNYRFPDDDACLEEIKRIRFGDELECPKCHRTNQFYRVKGRTAFACSFCGHHIYPLKGSIFAGSSTPLKDWMYAIYLMVQTRAGISAKQLERELGCTYKTAWRMFHQIRKLMGDDEDMLSGEIEIDEAYFHPNPTRRSTAKPHNSQIVLGMVERGGRARVKHVKSSGVRVLKPQIVGNVAVGATIYTDQWAAYKSLPRAGYGHSSINHSLGRHVDGQTHTQNVENLWSNIKRGIYGVYRHVDAQYLQAYVNEYTFRYSHRKLSSDKMFDALLLRIAMVYNNK